MENNRLVRNILTFLVVVAIPVGVYLVITPNESRLDIRAGRAEEALLFFMPAKTTLGNGEEAELSLKIDTGKETVGGIDVTVTYDPNYLSLVGKPLAGIAFPDLVIRHEEGRLFLQGESELIGHGSVLDFKIKGVGFGETKVEIDTSSVIWDASGKNNVLKKTAGVKVIIE